MRSLLFLLPFSIFPDTAIGQTTLCGTVLTTRGDTVVGANVHLPGTYDGATTDARGFFTFSTAERGERALLITFLGCDTFRQTVLLEGGALSLQPRLSESDAAIREVVISAGAFEAAGDRRRAVVLSPIDIALTASATADIAGAISTLPGTVRNGESGQILVRGGAAYETRTFIDGLYVQNPYNSSVPNLPARNRFSPFLFKGTLFSTGGYSAEYGQALSSALILQSDDLAPETSTGLSLMTVGAGLSHTRRWERTSASISGNYTNLAPYFALMPQTVDWIRPPQSGGAELTLRHQTRDEGMLKFYGSSTRSALRMNYPDPSDPHQTVPLALRAGNTYLNSSYRGRLGKDWILFAGAAFTWNRDDIETSAADSGQSGSPMGGLDKSEQSLQTRFSVSRSVRSYLRLKFGAEYLRGRYDESVREAGLTVRRGEHYGAGFAETDLFLSKKVVARLGLRAERSGLLDRSNLAPRLSAAYMLGPDEQVAMAFGRFYQTPAYDLLRQTTDLRFERATHYMVNYQRIRHGLTFRAEAYYKTYDDLVQSAAPDRPAGNGGSGYARGVDLFFRDKKTIRHGDYWVSYSFLDTERDYRDFPAPAVPTFAAAHNLSVVYKHWLPAINTAVGATYGFQSGRPYHDPNAAGFNAGRTPAYHDLSLNASYLTNLGGHFTILYVSATNILGFDQTYGYQFAATPGPDGRFASRAITPPARRFVFAGLFVNFGQRYKRGETPDL